jgi:hypothetical protein
MHSRWGPRLSLRSKGLLKNVARFRSKRDCGPRASELVAKRLPKPYELTPSRPVVIVTQSVSLDGVAYSNSHRIRAFSSPRQYGTIEQVDA